MIIPTIHHSRILCKAGFRFRHDRPVWKSDQKGWLGNSNNVIDDQLESCSLKYGNHLFVSKD